MRSNLLKKFISFSFGGYIALVIGFFTTPIVTRMLSPKEYGISSMYTLAINLLSLLVILGLDQGFVRYFYEESDENKGTLLKKCLKLPFVLLIIFSIFIFSFKEKVSEFIFLEYNSKMIMLFVLLLIFSVLNRYSFLIVRMNQKAKLFSILQILLQLLNFIFIILLFRIYGDNYKTIVMGTSLTTIILTVFTIFTEKKNWNLKGQKCNVVEKELIKYSFPFTITLALNWLFQSSDKIVIKMISGIEEVGLYAAAFKIVALLNIIQTGFTAFWIPIAYEKYTEDPKNLDFFEKIHGYISLLMFIVALITLMSKDLIILLLGEKFRVASNIVPCLVLMPIMYTISETTVIGINFKKKTKYHIIISIIVAILNIIGNIILVPKIGAVGAAISTGVAYIVFFALRTYFSLKQIQYNFNLKRFYISVIIILGYALNLTFSSKKNTFLLGVLFLTIILILYKNIIKEIFFEIKKYCYKKK